jgi:hypothetical protein
MREIPKKLPPPENLIASGFFASKPRDTIDFATSQD